MTRKWEIDVNILAVLVRRLGGDVKIINADLQRISRGEELHCEYGPEDAYVRLHLQPAPIDAEFRVIS